MNNKQKGSVGMVVAIVIAIIVLGGIWYGVSKSKGVVDSNIPSGWKTYKNDQYGFSLSLPSKYEISYGKELCDSGDCAALAHYWVSGSVGAKLYILETEAASFELYKKDLIAKNGGTIKVEKTINGIPVFSYSAGDVTILYFWIKDGIVLRIDNEGMNGDGPKGISIITNNI
ncbi:MAG: hypothetical protein AAB534_03445 [Patescibacteria group bacterium]